MKTTGMRWLIGAVLVALLGTGVSAQQAPDIEQEPTGESDEAPEPGTTANADDESPDVFVPTEEISEDAAVPFPVDI